MDLNRAALEDLLAPHALDAVDEDERSAIEEAITNDTTVANRARWLQEAAGWLGTREAMPPPDALRTRVLAAVRERPSPAAEAVAPISVVEAFAEQVEDLVVLL